MIVSDAFSPAYASNCAKPCLRQRTFGGLTSWEIGIAYRVALELMLSDLGQKITGSIHTH